MKNIKPVAALVERIQTHMALFKQNMEEHLNTQTKASSARARKQAMILRGLLKDYRPVTVEFDKAK